MAEHASFTELAWQLGEVVRAVMDDLRPGLVDAALSGDRGERGNVRHADNFLSRYDLRAHNRYRELIEQLLPGGFVYASEEVEPEVIGGDPEPDLCVLVDPLDTSELAVRALHGYTHVLVYLAPGHYILHAAGGTVLALNGESLPLDHGLSTLADIAKAMAPRQKFVATASPQLARQILATLHTR
jgi:fructose-1,6-bisphosphatase/inositol monophosphatase family enzyme